MSANVKKRLRLEYLGKDKPNEPGVEAAGADALDIITDFRGRHAMTIWHRHYAVSDVWY